MTKPDNDFTSPPQFGTTAQGLLIRAPAKINLSLLIADKRQDGFHNLETIMTKISLYDELYFTDTDTDGIELVCGGKYTAPVSSENLVYKAAQIFFRQINKKPKIKITLTKNIPAAAGLGGASSDAAATLLALNRLYHGIMEKDTLSSLAADLGSDVPFFLTGPMAFCTGRGEKIQEISKKFRLKALLILPNISVSTKKVYEKHKVNLPLFNDLSSKIKSFINQNRLDLIANMCANMLGKTSFEVSTDLMDIKTRAESILREPVRLSGSGSSLFSVVSGLSDEDIEITQQRITKSLGCECIVVFHNQW